MKGMGCLRLGNGERMSKIDEGGRIKVYELSFGLWKYSDGTHRYDSYDNAGTISELFSLQIRCFFDRNDGLLQN